MSRGKIINQGWGRNINILSVIDHIICIYHCLPFEFPPSSPLSSTHFTIHPSTSFIIQKPQIWPHWLSRELWVIMVTIHLRVLKKSDIINSTYFTLNVFSFTNVHSKQCIYSNLFKSLEAKRNTRIQKLPSRHQRALYPWLPHFLFRFISLPL